MITIKGNQRELANLRRTMNVWRGQSGSNRDDALNVLCIKRQNILKSNAILRAHGYA